MSVMNNLSSIGALRLHTKSHLARKTDAPGALKEELEVQVVGKPEPELLISKSFSAAVGVDFRLYHQENFSRSRQTLRAEESATPRRQAAGPVIPLRRLQTNQRKG